MIDGIKLMGTVLEENMTTFAVRVVTEHIKEHNGLKELFIFFAKTEVVVLGIIVDILLEGSRTIRTIIAQSGKGDNMKTKCFAHQVGGNFASS